MVSSKLKEAPLLPETPEKIYIDKPGQEEVVIQRVEWFIRFLGFGHYSPLAFVLSWVVFLFVGFALPVAALELSGKEKYKIRSFEMEMVISEMCMAAVSLIYVGRSMRNCGLRKFMFMDFSSENRHHSQSILSSIWLFTNWMVVSFVLKTGRECVRLFLVQEHDYSKWRSLSIMVCTVLSSTYTKSVSLTGAILFHLVCNVQMTRFDNYGRLLAREGDVGELVKEHGRLMKCLSNISHTFRMYLVLLYVMTTVNQIVNSCHTVGYNNTITTLNNCDFAASSLVQLAQIVICLNAATKITNKSQRIVSMASRWHLYATCTTEDDDCDGVVKEVLEKEDTLELCSTQNDLESLENAAFQTQSLFWVSLSSYHKRQSFVTYMRSNAGGITVFGWMVDRNLVNTMFFMQFSLTSFVLGNTIASTSST